MNEEKFYYGAIDFWEKNKDLDSLHLLNKFMKEKYFPLDEKIKEVREYIENNKQYAELEDYGKNGEYYIDEIGLLEILEKEK